MALAIGEFVGDYEVVDHLGSGGMGEVYKIRHVISQRIEALKLLHDHDLGSAESCDRFAREIRVLATLQHPNIAVLHTAFRIRDRLAMVMEYAEGVTLTAKLRPPGITLTEGLFYISQVLSALAYAHRHGVVHRDVKPANMIIAADNRLKLVDFGVALSGRDARLTSSGQVVGSFHYMSPEQINGDTVDARSDLYSVGITLYEVATGRLPIEGPNQYSIMTGHLNRVPISPSEIAPQIPANLSALVMKALAKDPSGRYQTAEHFLAELTAIQSDCAATMATMVTVLHPAGRTSDARPERPPSSRKSDSHSPMLADHPGMVDEVGKELASFIGPIARIIVKRAAKECSTVHELFAAVAPEIDSAKDREKFLAARRRYLR